MYPCHLALGEPPKERLALVPLTQLHSRTLVDDEESNLVIEHADTF